VETTKLKSGQYSALAVAVLTSVTFGAAMLAIPPSGPYCPGDCMEYPFPNIIKYYPRDYIWMYLGVFQLGGFLFYAIANHFNAPSDKQVFSFTGVAFAVIAATVLLIAYWVQVAVVPTSVMNGEQEGIALLTQYNGHGIFIALEELGFVAMSLSLFCLAPSVNSEDRLGKIIRLLFRLPAALMLIAFVAYAARFGLDREYRFEVAAISINWLALIVLGILQSIQFGKRSRQVHADR
jgi:hypothetical protein